MSSQIRSALLVLMALVLLPGCSSGVGQSSSQSASSANDSAPAMGSQWRLTQGLAEAVPDTVEITLQFGDAAVSGFGGCNRYRSTARLDGLVINLSPPVASKRGCMGPAGQLEPQFFGALQRAQRAEVVDGQLRLVLSDGGELRFDPVVGAK